MNYKIREISENEYSKLSDFLYEAIFIPEGMANPPKSGFLNEQLVAHERYFPHFAKIISSLKEGGYIPGMRLCKH